MRVQPDKIDNVNFVANAALQKLDAVAPLYEESLPHWRKVVAAKPADAQSEGVLTGILIQLANFKLGKQDKAGAAPLYAEALQFARGCRRTAQFLNPESASRRPYWHDPDQRRSCNKGRSRELVQGVERRRHRGRCEQARRAGAGSVHERQVRSSLGGSSAGDRGTQFCTPHCLDSRLSSAISCLSLYHALLR